MLVWLLAMGLAISSGCGRISFDPVRSQSLSDATGPLGDATGGSDGFDPMCRQVEALPSQVPITVAGTTVDKDNDAAGSCGGNDAPDYTYGWVVPQSRTYRFHTCAGVRSNTVLYIRRNGCGGAEVGCNNDAAACSPGSELTMAFGAGEVLYVFVDGFSGDLNFTLSVEPQ